jgi:hypothetical protein
MRCQPVVLLEMKYSDGGLLCGCNILTAQVLRQQHWETLPSKYVNREKFRRSGARGKSTKEVWVGVATLPFQHGSLKGPPYLSPMMSPLTYRKLHKVPGTRPILPVNLKGLVEESLWVKKSFPQL